jgi:hypothetical protein
VETVHRLLFDGLSAAQVRQLERISSAVLDRLGAGDGQPKTVGPGR